jgi:hypothetical protein
MEILNKVVMAMSRNSEKAGAPMGVVFRRFHRQHEFEITNVVLTSIKRNIDRRDGREWRESVFNKGTAFTFHYPEI